MKSISKLLLLLFLTTLVFPSNVVLGLGHDFEALKKEYPMLMKRYGNRLESRTAHYIFAIDISSSMQEYENVVRQSLATFVKAVPDGDQITLIAMSDENNTNYVNSIKCITINPKVRQSIVQTITSPQFRFLRTGDKSDGSDGCTMTRKVLEAMNVVNSSDLTFVYLLTDFEYWTHKFKFDKTLEDWSGLKSLLTDKHKGMMCKYGIELNSSKVSHPEAIFKPELDNIFGPLDYQQANSALILAQWFGHIINDIRAHKINAMLKADWKEYLDSISVSLQKDGRDLNAVINTLESDLVSGATVTLANGGGKHLEPLKEVPVTVCDENVWEAAVGRYKTDRTWYPSYLKEDASDARLLIFFDSPYAEEIHKLQGLCQEKADSPNAVRFNQEYSVNTPAAKVWNSIVPLWVYLLVILVIIGVIASIVYTMMIHPERRDTSILVKRRSTNESKPYTGDAVAFPVTIGNGCDINVPGANWTLKIFARRYNPIITWCSLGKFKSGYYAILETGDYADIVNDYTDENICTLSTAKSVLLFPYKKAPKSRIEISEGNTKNIIVIN